MLDADERALFDLLGVFSGSFDLDAVGNISGKADVADLVEGLVLKSMVVTEPDEGTTRRYRLLDSLRAFAMEQLATRPEENERALDTHARHYLARVAGLPPSRSMARELRSELEPDLGNILVASDRAVADVTEPLVFLLTNMGLFDEARRSCDAALASDIDDQRRGRLLVARAYVEATQDGTSDFRLRAADALRYLTPGDGVWSAALGMTSVVEQMFAPDRAVPALQEAIASIDDQVSATADHDRAVLGFYLGGALMNQRAYELAAETQLEAARRLEVIEPTSLVRLWTGAGAAMSFTMLGQLDEASAAIDEVSGLAGWTDWSADWYFARAVLLADRGQIDEGARRCERSEHASTTSAWRRWSARWLPGLACWPASRAVTVERRSSSICSPPREPPHRRRSCTKPSVTSRVGATRSSRTDGSSGSSESSSNTGRWNGQRSSPPSASGCARSWAVSTRRRRTLADAPPIRLSRHRRSSKRRQGVVSARAMAATAAGP